MCALVVLTLLGCERGATSGDTSASTRPDGLSIQTESEGEPAPEIATPPEAAFVYTAVLRQGLIEAWVGRGESGFEVIFVVDGVVPRAANPIRTEDPRNPFPADLKEGMRLLAEQEELPPIEFVPEREAALRGPGAGRNAARVKDRGLLVSLGRIQTSARRVKIGTTLWVDAKGARWLTYVVKEKDSGWRVVGTTGRLAIS